MASTSRTTSRTEQAERSRQRLIDAASRLFAERGYRDTSVQAIGEAAGISRGSIFWHFGSKEGLLWAVVERAFADWETGRLVPDVGSATGVEAVHRALRAHRAFLAGNATTLHLFYVLMFEALGPRPDLAARFAALHDRLRALGAAWLRAGIAAGDLRPDVDPDALATILIGALGGLAYQHLLDPGGIDLDRAYAELEALVARGIAVPAGAGE